MNLAFFQYLIISCGANLEVAIRSKILAAQFFFHGLFLLVLKVIIRAKDGKMSRHTYTFIVPFNSGSRQ